MKLKSIALAAALAVSGAASFAGTSTFDADGAASFANDPLAVGAFTQTITFSGLASGTYDIEGTLSAQNITWTSIFLDGNPWTIIAAGGKKTFASLEVTSTTPMVLTLIGVAGKQAKYSGELTVTAVPEPETYAMLLAGLGLMGTIARRRTKAANA